MKLDNIILIFSSNIDSSTNEVINWLIYKNKKYIRVNDFNLNKQLELTVSTNGHVKISAEGTKGKISSAWLRRYPNVEQDDFLLEKKVKEHLRLEIKEFIVGWASALFFCAKTLGVNKNYGEFLNVNKIFCLYAAQKSGLQIPLTLLTNSKESILLFNRVVLT